MKYTQVRTENNSHTLESNQDHNIPYVDNPIIYEGWMIASEPLYEGIEP